MAKTFRRGRISKKLNILNTNIDKIKCTEDGCACSIM